MILVILRHFSAVVSRRTHIKGVAIPGRRTFFRRVVCPRRLLTKGLCNGLVILMVRVMNSRKPIISFKPVQKDSTYQFETKHLPINCWVRYESYQKHSEHTKYKEMTPSEFNRFDSFIKGILQLVYGFNLHFYSSLSDASIMTSKSLKSYLFDSDIYNCLGYSGKKSSVLRITPR
jgi:hypothetical protein